MSPTQQFQHPAPVHHLAITQIRPKPEHHYFGHDARHVLSEGMAAFWLIQPIVVRRVGDSFEIVSGKRRWLATLKLGWRSIHAAIQND